MSAATYADGCEANTQTSDSQHGISIDHCGACGGTCPLKANNTDTVCSAGACQVNSCSTGYADCNKNLQTDGCEIALNSATNCGACGVACASPKSCTTGTCL